MLSCSQDSGPAALSDTLSKKQKPDISVRHIGSNNVSFRDSVDNESRNAGEIISIGKTCSSHGSEVFISLILLKASIKLSAVIRKINDELCVLCTENNF